MPKRERHLDEQLGLLVCAGLLILVTFFWITCGWFARGYYEDHVARQIVKRLCEEGVMCAELAD